jgi:hypothetical protein
MNNKIIHKPVLTFECDGTPVYTIKRKHFKIAYNPEENTKFNWTDKYDYFYDSNLVENFKQIDESISNIILEEDGGFNVDKDKDLWLELPDECNVECIVFEEDGGMNDVTEKYEYDFVYISDFQLSEILHLTKNVFANLFGLERLSEFNINRDNVEYILEYYSKVSPDQIETIDPAYTSILINKIKDLNKIFKFIPFVFNSEKIPFKLGVFHSQMVDYLMTNPVFINNDHLIKVKDDELINVKL